MRLPPDNAFRDKLSAQTPLPPALTSPDRRLLRYPFSPHKLSPRAESPSDKHLPANSGHFSAQTNVRGSRASYRSVWPGWHLDVWFNKLWPVVCAVCMAVVRNCVVLQCLVELQCQFTRWQLHALRRNHPSTWSSERLEVCALLGRPSATVQRRHWLSASCVQKHCIRYTNTGTTACCRQWDCGCFDQLSSECWIILLYTILRHSFNASVSTEAYYCWDE